MRSGLGAGGKAALAGLVALSSIAALASPAQGARYAASVQLRESPTRIDSVSGFGKEVWIVTPTTRRDSLFARYSGPGRTTRRGVFGQLGRFGSVMLRFRPEGKPSRMRRPDSCTGGPKVWVRWSGTFRGSIRFDPDAHLHGFARTGSFAGQVETVPSWHCPQALKPPTFDPGAGGIDVNTTNCDGRSFDATVEVDPVATPPPLGDGEATPADFSASWTKSVGIARVSYSISVEGVRIQPFSLTISAKARSSPLRPSMARRLSAGMGRAGNGAGRSAPASRDGPFAWRGRASSPS